MFNKWGELSMKFHRWPFPSGKIFVSAPVITKSSHWYQHSSEYCSWWEKRQCLGQGFAGHYGLIHPGTEHPRNGSLAMLLLQLSAWQWEQAKSPTLLTQLEIKSPEVRREPGEGGTTSVPEEG